MLGGEIRTCVTCNRKYWATTDHQKHCSRRCNTLSAVRRYNARQKEKAL